MYRDRERQSNRYTGAVDVHVKVLGALYIVYGIFGLALALIMLFIFGGVTGLVGLAAADDPEVLLAVPIIGAIGSFIVGLMLLLSVPRILAGVGLLKFRPWARVLAIVLSILGLVNFPFGTALGVYGLWVLLSGGTTPLFRAATSATPGAPPPPPA